jgi:hypothetical protein
MHERKSMNRKLKTLGVAFASVIAMAVFAGSASATLALFHSETGHTEIKGEQEGQDVFTTNTGSVQCKTVTYTGTASTGTPTELDVAPTFSGCSTFGFVNMPIDTNGCHYKFKSHPTTPPVLHILCPTAPITITAFNCYVTIGSQTVSHGISYTNKGAGTTRDITVDVNISSEEGLTYTQHSKSFPGCSNGTFTNGTYTGLTTVKATNTAGTQVGIWWQ